jgi:hypothetical protein
MFLLVLSVISLCAAAVVAVLAWSIVRDDRQRSAARVAALASTALDESATVVAIHERPEGGPYASGVDRTSGFDGTFHDQGDRTPSVIAATRPAAVQGHPLVKVAVGIAMSLALIVFIAMSGDRRQDRGPAPTTVAATQQDSALELLSMRHDREGDTLSVTGLVRNPGAGAARGIIAVVFAFDHSGNFVASGRAPLDFVTLAPGDESPFRVTIPHVNDVGRYRVSFRTESGVVRHVDRRAALQASAR